MAKAIDVLVSEHHVIGEMLSSLEAFIEALGDRPDRERAAVREYAQFFHDLVDVCHHGKEEKYLFPRMHAFGFAREAGPISAMLSEQDEGRDHLSALSAVGRGEGPLLPVEQELVKGHALAYVMRIRAHMSREEAILFPMASHSLPGFVMDEISRGYLEFEKEDLPEGLHETLLRISQSLTALYPPQPPGRRGESTEH
jgi:hemerythrin-like domain-containing protein